MYIPNPELGNSPPPILLSIDLWIKTMCVEDEKLIFKELMTTYIAESKYGFHTHIKLTRNTPA